MKANPNSTASRVFVRSLNILLKFARLYGYEHVRTVEQFKTAWDELRAAISGGSDGGLLLGATGSQLLLDGVPLEGTPAEKQFAQLLSAAGLASIQFHACVTEEELAHFARAFPTGKAKPAELAEQLKTALASARGIHVNEICFVATDSRLKEASIAAQLAAASLGDDQDVFKRMLNDPQKLLELIAAAEGSKSGAGGASGAGEAGSGLGGGGGLGSGAGAGPGSGAGTGAGSGPGTGNGTGSGARGSGNEPTDEEIYSILRALTAIGSVGKGPNPAAAAVEFQDQVSQMPQRGQELLRSALAEIAEKGKGKKLDQAMLVQLAEHLSIRFALEHFERGDMKVNAVRQMLDRMNKEIEALRTILGQHEDKMTEAGILVESHRETLDRMFWASVPENIKREVLLSEEAWCIPAKNVQAYVMELFEHGEIAEANSVLQNYAKCADSEEPEARKRAATGLAELAGLYAQGGAKLLAESLRQVGLRLNVEQDQDLQPLVSAAFVRLSQEAAAKRCFQAMEQALELVAGLEVHRPGVGRTLRAKMGIEERVPEFVDEALRVRKASHELTEVLKQLPQTAMEQLALRFNRCQFRDDLENVANLAQDLGQEGVEYLRDTIRGGPPAEAVEMVGLLVRLDLTAAEIFLPTRLKDFPRAAQDRVVRQIASCQAPGRCRILLAVLDHVDPLIMPLVVDELGISEDREALGRLLTLVEGDLPAGAAAFLRIKAFEALGRIKAPVSVNALKRILETRKTFGWMHPQELRIAALQALERIDPGWTEEYLPKSGIDREDLRLAPLEVPHDSRFLRHRRHTRVRLRHAVTAVSTNLKRNCQLDIKTVSLTGGLATTNMHLAPGTQVQLRMQVGLRKLQATALMRDYRAQDMAFEIVDMGLEERNKFRKLLLDNLAPGGGSREG